MSCNCALLYEFNVKFSILVPFPTPSETSRVGTWGYIFFFRVPTLMVSDGCGLDELLCALLYEFNVELSIIVPFHTPSGAFEDWNVGMYSFYRVPILMASDCGGFINCNQALLYEFNIKLSIVDPFPSPSEALRVGT